MAENPEKQTAWVCRLDQCPPTILNPNKEPGYKFTYKRCNTKSKRNHSWPSSLEIGEEKKVCSTSEVKVVKKLNMKIYPIQLPEGRRKKKPA